MPARLELSLLRLLNALRCLGVAEGTAWWLVGKCALDSMPANRRQALEYLMGRRRQHPRARSRPASVIRRRPPGVPSRTSPLTASSHDSREAATGVTSGNRPTGRASDGRPSRVAPPTAFPKARMTRRRMGPRRTPIDLPLRKAAGKPGKQTAPTFGQRQRRRSHRTSRPGDPRPRHERRLAWARTGPRGR